jgi:hypothetical protein
MDCVVSDDEAKHGEGEEEGGGGGGEGPNCKAQMNDRPRGCQPSESTKRTDHVSDDEEKHEGKEEGGPDCKGQMNDRSPGCKAQMNDHSPGCQPSSKPIVKESTDGPDFKQCGIRPAQGS